MRPQSGGYSYEDFQPKSEWKREEGANILLLQLPGFSKEQITYEQSNRIIRVLGEQPIGNNIWRRFNQAFVIPENCKTDKIYSSFENENFKIIMPKEIVTQVGSTQAAKTAQETPIPPKATSEEGGKEKSVSSQIPQKDIVEPMAQKGRRGYNENPPQIDSTKRTIEQADSEKDEKEKSEANRRPTESKNDENVEDMNQVIEKKDEESDKKDTAKSMAQKGQKGHDETPPKDASSTSNRKQTVEENEKKKKKNGCCSVL